MPERNVRKKTDKRSLFLSGKMDLTFFLLVLGLLTAGLIMLFSASAPYASVYYKNSYHFILRQFVFAIGGMVSLYFFSRLDYHVFRKFAWPIFGISMMMLLAVLVTPEVVPGFKRWLRLGPITFQPSEVGKFALAVLMAALISANYKRMKETKFIIFLFSILAVVCGLVIAEKHLSATIIVALIGIVIMFIGGLPIKYFVGMGAIAGTGAVLVVVTGLIQYAMSRFTYWIDPWADMTGKGYQTIQSLLAIGSGGVMGQGIGQSNQKYLWVPEPQNDFIFSIVCEELGLIGALFIVIGFAMLVWRGFIIALRAQDKFGTLLVIGLVFQVGLQTVLNMLVVTNTIPNTGISLPFFSAGGTSLLMLLTQMGVVLSVSRTANMKKV